MQGRTTQQMLNAPHEAVYVWYNSDLAYPKALAARVGRSDLKVVAPFWLLRQVRGGRGMAVIDHALYGLVLSLLAQYPPSASGRSSMDAIEYLQMTGRLVKE